jgi:hypothetical protein
MTTVLRADTRNALEGIIKGQLANMVLLWVSRKELIDRYLNTAYLA